MKDPDSAPLPRIIIRTVVIFTGLHLTLCLFLIFFPHARIPGSPALTSFYRIHLLPGPFFKEELIAVNPHLQLAHKSLSGSWSAWREPAREDFLAYQDDFWKYYKRKQATFERTLGKGLARKIIERGENGYLQSNELRELQHYFDDQYLPTGTDSVRLLYRLDRYDPASGQTKSDTVFNIKYKSF